ncbi:MAG: thioredoxin [Rubrivivax sp.]
MLHVVCLCAAWCRTCESYAETLQAVLADFRARGLAAPPRWIDIEDEAELLDDLDIEIFPTLLVHDGARLLFAGALTPQPQALQRLLQGLAGRAGEAVAPAADPAFEALLRRLLADG